MPEIRALCMDGEKGGKPVIRVANIDDLTHFESRLLLRKS
jgi:hypothetical protein